jgi:hypothetical protein
MNTKTKIIIGAIVIIGISFYGGYMYGQSSASAATSAAFATRAAGGFGGARGGARTAGGGLVSGQILTVDAQGITVKLQSGGSSIVYVSPSTTVMKTVTGVQSDLVVGKTVTVTGSTNSDGSVNATSVQIRPAQMGTSTPAVPGQ